MFQSANSFEQSEIYFVYLNCFEEPAGEGPESALVLENIDQQEPLMNNLPLMSVFNEDCSISKEIYLKMAKNSSKFMPEIKKNRIVQRLMTDRAEIRKCIDKVKGKSSDKTGRERANLGLRVGSRISTFSHTVITRSSSTKHLKSGYSDYKGSERKEKEFVYSNYGKSIYLNMLTHFREDDNSISNRFVPVKMFPFPEDIQNGFNPIVKEGFVYQNEKKQIVLRDGQNLIFFEI